MPLPDSLALPSAGYTRQKASLHSANSLPSVTLGKRHSTKPPTAKGSLPSVGFRALDKDFAESLGTRQSSHVAPPWAGTLPSARSRHSAKFETLPSGATWPLCRVLDPGTRQTFETLPSARVLALGKAATCCPVEGHFAECIGLSTRQSGLFFFFCFFFLCFSIQQIYI